MIVDEMDLVSQLKDAAPLRPSGVRAGAGDAAGGDGRVRARTGAGVVPAPGAAPAREEDFPWARSRRGTLGTAGKVGIGAGIGAVAAAVAVVLVATSTPRSAAPAGSSTGASTGSAAQPPAATSPLVTLAAHIKASDGSPLPGNASLVIVDQGLGGKTCRSPTPCTPTAAPMYSGDDKKTLMSAIDPADNQADSGDTREVAARATRRPATSPPPGS